MGAKTNYAHAVLDAMGLRPGQGAESYLWCEADLDVRNLLIAYTQPALLRAAAEVLRGWKDEEPRALWTRLRDERRARKAALPLDQSVAEWMFLHHGSFNNGANLETIGRPQGAVVRSSNGGDYTFRPSLDIVHDAAERLATGPGWPPVAVTSSAPSVEEVAGWIAMQGMRHPGGGGFAPSVVSPQYGGANGPGRLNRSPWTAEKAAHAMGRTTTKWPPTCITSRAPTAEEVAGWLFTVAVGHPAGGGFMGEFHALCPAAQRHMGPTTCRKYAEKYGVDVRGWPFAPHGKSREEIAKAIERLVDVSSRPTEPTPGVDLEGCVVYMDPDYVGTTGYAATMPRAEVVRLATSYAAAGALVVVSEAVPIPELTALGWEAIDIAGERRGARRTFSADGGANEWLTMSRPPVNRPAKQVGMFGP